MCHTNNKHITKWPSSFKAKHVVMYTNHVQPFACLCFRLPLRKELSGQTLPDSSCCAIPWICLFSVWRLDFEAIMSYRTVVMYMEIVCFIICVTGWILVCSTMPTEIWTWSEVDSIVLTTSNYFSNLWKDCISDSTGVSDCKGIPSMLALNCKYFEHEAWLWLNLDTLST